MATELLELPDEMRLVGITALVGKLCLADDRRALLQELQRHLETGNSCVLFGVSANHIIKQALELLLTQTSDGGQGCHGSPRSREQVVYSGGYSFLVKCELWGLYLG